MFLTQVAKVMNKSVQSVLRWVYRGERSFKKGDGRLPISYNNGVIGATSPPSIPPSLAEGKHGFATDLFPASAPSFITLPSGLR